MAKLLRQLYVSTTGTGYSQPIEMGKFTAAAISVTTTVCTAAGTVTVEGSNDLVNWGTSGISGSGVSTGTAPNSSSGLFTGIAYAYIRVKVAPSTGPLIVDVDVAPYIG